MDQQAPEQAFMSALATEHFVLQAARSAIVARWNTAWRQRSIQGRPAGHDLLPGVSEPGPSCGSGAGTKRCTRVSGSTSPRRAAIPDG
jgi:hypothetical protein